MSPLRQLFLTISVASATAFNTAYNESFSKTMTFYAATAHCESNVISSWTCVPCAEVPTPVKVIVVDATLRGGSLQAYAAKFADGGVIVSYRGTIGTLQDWLLDFEFFYKNISYPGCEGCGAFRSGLDRVPLFKLCGI